METNRWQQWVLAIAGAWILISPWVLGGQSLVGEPGAYVLWSHVLIGGAVAVLAIAALVTFQAWEEWVMVILGLATVAMPWLLGFSGNVGLTGSDLAAGVVVTALAGWAAFGETA
jgi:hypothetical protein